MSGVVTSHALEMDMAHVLRSHRIPGTYGHLILSEQCKRFFCLERKAPFELKMVTVNRGRTSNALTEKRCASGNSSVAVVTVTGRFGRLHSLLPLCST